MPVIRSALWGPLVMGDVLTKIVILSQLSDEVLECFVFIGIVPHVLIVVIVLGCVTLCRTSLHPREPKVTILIRPIDEFNGCYNDAKACA